MKNTKLMVLLKELPWLRDVDPWVSKVSDMHVLRLDISSLMGEWAGLSISGRRTRRADTKGFFVDKNGKVLGTVHPEYVFKYRVIDIFRKFFDIYRRGKSPNIRRIIDAVWDAPFQNAVHFVVILGKNSPSGDVSLLLYKLPRGQTLSDLVSEYTAQVQRATSAEITAALDF